MNKVLEKVAIGIMAMVLLIAVGGNIYYYFIM